MKFRKKPVQIEAVQWLGQDLWQDRINNKMLIDAYEQGNFVITAGGLYIKTLEGTMAASIGDWIIKGVNGEFYPCKPDIFHKTYDAV